MAKPTQIKLFTDSTPNGIKITMALEELGLSYEIEHIDLKTNRQKEPWFLEINPNGRIPAILDTLEDGTTVRIFEGGSILQYLTERYDTENKLSFPRGSKEFWECNNWLFFQHGGIGPMQGQAAHFYRYAPTKIEYGIDRYTNETRRLYRVLEDQLSKSTSGYLVGDHISIADIANLSWVIYGAYVGIDMSEFPNLKKWDDMLSARAGIYNGFNIPKKLMIKEKADDPEFFNRIAKETSQWILKGMEEDKKANTNEN